MTPDLLFHPVFDEAEALAGMPDRKVVHPTAQHRVDHLHYPVYWLRLVAAKHAFELPQQRRAFLELGRVVNTPYTPATAHAAEVESQEAEALASTEVHDLTLLFINFHLQFGQFLPKSLQVSVNGMVRPCSCPASDKLARGAKDKEHAMSEIVKTTTAVIGIDIGKNSFHIVGLDQRGAIVLRQKWSRSQVETRFANMPPCLIGMEACVGAHHLSRRLKALGHDARLMPARYVRPYSKGQKNDFRDAEAIAEAVQRPTMKFVATKTADQLDLQALHRVRERLVSQRTGIINQIRAFLLERGVAVRQGLRFLRAELPRILAEPPDVLSARMVRVIEDLAGDWRRLDERIESYRMRSRLLRTRMPVASG